MKGSVSSLAVLPMYDWPEITAQTDLFWESLRDRLAEAGFSAPGRLDREIGAEAAWSDPNLLIGQTCGLPFVSRLKGRVKLIGAPSYALKGCPPGHYCSVIVVSKENAAEKIGDLRGAQVAFNTEGSQSGYAALLHAVAPHAADGRFFAKRIRAGSHRESIRTVARGQADVAAIDAVSWELALRHEGAAERLRVLSTTPPTPGLPFITSWRDDEEVQRIADAAEAAIAGLDALTAGALLMNGFVRFGEDAYDLLKARVGEAVSAGYARLD